MRKYENKLFLRPETKDDLFIETLYNCIVDEKDDILTYILEILIQVQNEHIHI